MSVNINSFDADSENIIKELGDKSNKFNKLVQKLKRAKDEVGIKNKINKTLETKLK